MIKLSKFTQKQLSKTLLQIFVTVFFGVVAKPSARADENHLEGAPLFLEVGEQRILPFAHIDRYSISNPEVVRYLRISGQEAILIKALKPGLATLYVSSSSHHSETHAIRIEGKKNSLYPHSLLQALNLLKTTEVMDGGDRYLLRGVVTSTEEARAISNLKERFPTYIADETTHSANDLNRILVSLKKLLANHLGLTFENQSGVLAVHGGVSTLTAKDALTRQIHAIDPLVTIDLQTVKDSDPTLYFKVYLLEVKKELISNLGIQWPEVHPGSLNLNPVQFLAGDSIDLQIHALVQKNLVRVLSSPELVVKAPGQAELFAGGELPIHSRSKFNDSILWKNIGLSLKLDVKEYGGEKVRLQIETEMSHLDKSLNNGDLPGIQTNRMKTLVDGTLGKPLLLSGLLQEDMRNGTSGIPGLSSLPVLGKLFSSEDYQNSRSEFVAILLPERNTPAQPMQRISTLYPRGYLPVPRNHLSETEKEETKNSRNYPWNAL
jgi:Flp pilus assembly secretin CpaC